MHGDLCKAAAAARHGSWQLMLTGTSWPIRVDLTTVQLGKLPLPTQGGKGFGVSRHLSVGAGGPTGHRNPAWGELMRVGGSSTQEQMEQAKLFVAPPVSSLAIWRATHPHRAVP